MFSPKQKLAYRMSTKRYNLASGTMTSGKTYLYNILFGLLMLGKFGYIPPEKDFLIMGKTLGTVRQNVINPMLEMFGSLAYLHSEEGLRYLHIGDRRAWFTGAGNAQSYVKLLGKQYAGLYADEVTELDINSRMQGTGRVMEGGRIYMTTNPNTPYHPIYKEYVAKKSDDISYTPFGLKDNPTLSQAKIDELKNTKAGLFYKRYILGQWVAAEGIIYDMYDPDKHVRPWVDTPILESNCFLDYGIGHAFVVMNIVKLTNGDRVCRSEYSYDSVDVGRQKTDDEYIFDILEYYHDNKLPINTPLICDPSITGRFRMALRKAGFTIRNANNTVIDGIEEVSSLLKRNKLWLVEGECLGAEKEFVSYAWDKKAQIRGDDYPLKLYDHRMDVIRYAANHYGHKAKRGHMGGRAI